MPTVDVLGIVVGLLCTIQVSLLSLDMSHCQRPTRLVQGATCIPIQLHGALITVNGQLELVILALHLGQQRAAISCTFEVAQQAKMYLCITKGLRGYIQLAIIVRVNTSLQTLLRRCYIFLLILCSHENPLSRCRLSDVYLDHALIVVRRTKKVKKALYKLDATAVIK